MTLLNTMCEITKLLPFYFFTLNHFSDSMYDIYHLLGLCFHFNADRVSYIPNKLFLYSWIFFTHYLFWDSFLF